MRPGSTRPRPTTSPALVAILLGLCPKFGAVVNATPGGVLGGITVVLYGMIGLVGAKIWVENRVDFGDPVNLVGLAAGLIIGIGNVTLEITDDFSLTASRSARSWSSSSTTWCNRAGAVVAPTEGHSEVTKAL